MAQRVISRHTTPPAPRPKPPRPRILDPRVQDPCHQNLPSPSHPTPPHAGQSKQRRCRGVSCAVVSSLSPSNCEVRSDCTGTSSPPHLAAAAPHSVLSEETFTESSGWRWPRGSCDGAQLRDRRETVGTRQVWVTELLMLIDAVSSVSGLKLPATSAWGSGSGNLIGNIHHARVTFRHVDEDRIV